VLENGRENDLEGIILRDGNNGNSNQRSIKNIV